MILEGCTANLAEVRVRSWVVSSSRDYMPKLHQQHAVLQQHAAALQPSTEPCLELGPITVLLNSLCLISRDLTINSSLENSKKRKIRIDNTKLIMQY